MSITGWEPDEKPLTSFRWYGDWRLGTSPDGTRRLTRHDRRLQPVEWLWEEKGSSTSERLRFENKVEQLQSIYGPFGSAKHVEPARPKIKGSAETQYFVRPVEGEFTPSEVHGPIDTEADARIIVKLLDGFNEKFAGSKWEAYSVKTTTEETIL